LGGKFAFTIGDKSGEHPSYERMQTIDYAFIFPRTAYLTRTPIVVPDVSVNICGPLLGKLEYEAEGTYYLVPVRDNLREEERTFHAGEFSATIVWNISNYFSFRGGMIASIGSYPFGTSGVLYPLMDIRIGFGL